MIRTIRSFAEMIGLLNQGRFAEKTGLPAYEGAPEVSA